MKNLTITLLTLLMSMGAWAADIEGSMSCTVKNIQITEVFEGKTKVFIGQEGVIEEGEKLKFTYKLIAGNVLSLQLSRDEQKYEDFRGIVVSALHFRKNFSREPSCAVCGRENQISFESDIGVFNTTAVWFGEDHIEIAQAHPLDSSRFSLHRYYKNDWDALFSSHIFENDVSRPADLDSRYAKTFSLNCREKDKNIGSIISYINSNW